jgi:hypothetical protein
MLPKHRLGQAIAVVGTVALLAFLLPKMEDYPSATVAFLGNSIIFVNDLPRFFQALSGDNLIHQNSCLHGSLNLKSIMQKGNGMYNKWKTENARISDVNVSKYGNGTIYDYGTCSFPQLMFGYDDNLFAEDGSSPYVNDGMNPCIQDPNYLNYLNDTYHPPTWDYVVLNDQTVAPGYYYSRRRSMRVLDKVYSDILATSRQTRPVFLVTHAYIKSEEASNASAQDIQLGDIPEFTSRIYYGYQQYAQTLAANLPPEQEPLLAPAGLAFLLLWEENYGMWEKLFFYDGFHPSPHGTYLIGCVLYATIFGRMPPPESALQADIGQLWSNARKMQIRKKNYPRMPVPTLAEANYLYRIAERVVLRGDRPSSLLDGETVARMEEDEGFGG